MTAQSSPLLLTPLGDLPQPLQGMGVWAKPTTAPPTSGCQANRLPSALSARTPWELP